MMLRVREKREQNRGGARPRHSEGQHRHERPARGRIVSRLRSRDSARVAGPERLAIAADRLLGHVGEEAAERCPGAGEDPGDEADHRRAQHREKASRNVPHGDRDPFQPDTDCGLLPVALDEHEHLRDREQPDDGDEEVDPVHQVQLTEGEARQPGLVVEADHRDPEPDGGGQRGLRLVPGGEPPERAEGEEVEGEVLRRPEEIRDAGEDRREQHEGDGREQGPDEGGDPGQHQRVAGPSLLRHGIAVEGGHQGRLVARDVEQDGRDAPPVHRSEVDGGP